jgi:hypothetical protein
MMEELPLRFICWPLIFKKKVVGILDFFSYILMKLWKKKSYNMLSLMLNGQGLRAFVLYLSVGHEQGVSIVEKHD